MNDVVTGRIALAAIDFQNEVRVWGHLPSPIATFLRTEAFPVSPPASLRGSPEYGGVKVVAYEGRQVCIARFFDGGKIDAFQRAIPSAHVLVVDAALLRDGFRNLVALVDCLDDMRGQEEVGYEHQLALLRSIFEEAAPDRSAEHFRALVARMPGGVELVARAMGLLVDRGRLVVCADARGEGESLFGALFALAPVGLLARTTWCTYVDSITGQHEDIVVYGGGLRTAAPAAANARSWTTRLRGRWSRADSAVDAAIDVASGLAQGHTRDGEPRARLATRVVRELHDDTLRLPLPFTERFRVCLGILDALCAGASYDVRELLDEHSAGGEAGLALRIEAFLAGR